MAKLTIEQILNLTPLQVRRTSEKALRGYTQTLADAMNKRVKRLLADEYGKNSEFIQALRADDRIRDGGGPTYTLEGKTTRAQVKVAFDELRIVYKAKQKTSVAGINKSRRQLEKRLGMPKGEHFSPDSYRKFFKAYRQIEADYGGNFPAGWGSNEVQKLISKERYKERGWDDIVKDVEAQLGEVYEKQEETERKQQTTFYSLLSEEDDLYTVDDDELPF